MTTKATYTFFYAVLIILISGPNIWSQVTGISGSKISSNTVDPVNHKELEFEPLFFHYQSSRFWNDSGELEELAPDGDSIRWVTGLNYRITYGIQDKFEIGASYSNDLLLATLGAKYVLVNNDDRGVALIGGINFPMGNKTVSRSIRYSNTIIKTGGGIIYSEYFSPDLSLDVNLQYFRFIKETVDRGKGNIFINADIGRYFFERQVQAIVGLGYQRSTYDQFIAEIFTVYPGFTIETGKNFIIVANGSFDLKGANAFKNIGVSLALTISLN